MESKKKNLTQARLKELLDYDPETGIFTWINRTGCSRSGRQAGVITKDGYIRIGIDNEDYLAARIAFLWMEGYFPEHDAEHKDRNRLNNKWSNLREATRLCNVRNAGVRNDNKSGVTGVSWREQKKRWVVQMQINRKNKYLGIFKHKKDAVLKRWEAEVEHGWPGCNTTSAACLYLKSRGFV